MSSGSSNASADGARRRAGGRPGKLDLVLFGASSFVGRLTAEYLARAAPEGARIGLAGRSYERLAALQASLGKRAGEWPLLIADTADQSALRELAERTRVLATTVGPYRDHGLPVVEACARAGTHYADLTGEVLFMRESIDRFDRPAADSGARIVHSCGFDSIPSDLGVMLLHEAALADGVGELEDTTLVVRAMRGGASGGTLASLKGTIDDARGERSLARLLADPYALSPDREREPDAGHPRMRDRDSVLPGRDAQLGFWTAPFIMGMVNTRVVRRSNALLGWAYGRDMHYREVMGFGAGPLAAAQASGVAASIGALVAGLALPPTRALLDRFLPDPGEGPSASARERGFFRIEIHARTPAGARYLCRVAAQGDPGYLATSVMFGETALCLAFDGDRLPARAGVLTPASAIGDVLVERLRAAGMTFEVERPG